MQHLNIMIRCLCTRPMIRLNLVLKKNDFKLKTNQWLTCSKEGRPKPASQDGREAPICRVSEGCSSKEGRIKPDSKEDRDYLRLRHTHWKADET